MTPPLHHHLQVLQRTPAALNALLRGLSDFWTSTNYGDKTFSPFDVVGHLIHAEQTNWLIRARTILERGQDTPFPAFDRYAMYEASKGKTMPRLLDEFAELRAANLAELQAMNLTQEHLNRRGTHPELGTVTLGNLLATWVVHDLGHTHQIVKSMAYQFRADVGPWVNYLTILPRP